MAPEVLDGLSDAYTTAVDVWSLGAVAYCARTKQPPFGSQSKLFNYMRRDIKFPLQPLGDSTGLCVAFIMAAMAVTPTHRLTIQQALNHPWLLTEGDNADRFYSNHPILKESAKN